MTVRYVGIGGNDASDGLSWANRKLTLNGAEDTPVASGDEVVVGPGTYRELLTCDVSGTSAITYTGDVSGARTDGVGGVVRITGSDNDTTATRANCITASSKNYRTFRGFQFDMGSSNLISNTSGNNWVIEDCAFSGADAFTDQCIYFINNAPADITVRRCIFISGAAVVFTRASSYSSASNLLVENCIFIGSYRGVQASYIGNIVVKNCLFIGFQNGGVYSYLLTGGETTTVYNSIFAFGNISCNAGAAGMITTDYCNRWSNLSADTNVTAGANDVTYPPGLAIPLLLDGLKYPWRFGELAPWSPLKRITGATGSSTDDLYGIERPVTSAKQSWGAIQYTGAIRATGTTQGSSAASIKLPDAGEQFLMRVPVTGVSTIVSVFCYREADYVGTNPQMILRQPGQSDITVTDTGSVSAWNQLSYTLTPSANPPYIEIWIKSLNTAVSGSYAAYWDTVSVS